MRRLVVGALLAAWSVCVPRGAAPRARAQTSADEAAERALLALDDAAHAAFLYGVRTLAPGYDGPSRAESVRALGHAVALLRATELAIVALERADAREAVAALREARATLIDLACPDEPGALHGNTRARDFASLTETCATTSDIVQAVREHVGAVREALDALAERRPTCPLVRALAARELRGAVETVRARLATEASMHDPAERAEIVAELREVVATLARPDDGRAFPPPPPSIQHVFEARALARYATAHAAYARDDGPRARRALASAISALVRSPDPSRAALATLARDVRAFEEALVAYRAGAGLADVETRLASSSDDPEVRDAAAALVPRLREAVCASPCVADDPRAARACPPRGLRDQ